MGAHTGNRRCSPSTSTARRRTRPPASSAAAAARRPSSPTTKPISKDDAAEGKARTKQACSRRRDMEVRRKMEVLRRLVPSGRGRGGDDEVDELLLRAAGYIARLQAQVTVMQFMVDVLEDTKH
ncbi:unnamed protein product [Miscanthus lutarioriparius]|uniref:BHLH domain-containing protein n=1 Tax=Miscanthus lutarioriparius TaxID=422564 RepID=A0A811RSS7_9POAL|nr:unnamed protein product [Miscanthus lutarioriparius]